MRAITHSVLLLLGVVGGVHARQDLKSSLALKDQETSQDKVTSILIHPGPSGPRHVILSEGHEIISSGQEGVSSRGNNYYFPSRAEEGEYHHTVPPPPHRVTYGPARPVTLRGPGQLYHHSFAQAHSPAKTSLLKSAKEDKSYSDSTHKYTSYIKHGKNKGFGLNGERLHTNRDYEKPNFSFYSKRPYDGGYSDYDDEKLFKESIGALHDDERPYDYSLEQKSRPAAYKKPQSYKQQYYSPVKGYKNQYHHYEEDDVAYKGNPSGFDDHIGGQVVPIVARFYKTPLPIIQTQLPVEKAGLYIQYVYPQTATYDPEITNNHYEHYPQERSSTYQSEWTPINAPSDTVPAKSYVIPAPDLSLRKVLDSSSVVIGKSKQGIGSANQHIQGNSEGVVSAVVRVKQ